MRELVTQMSSTEPMVIVNMIDPSLCESELGRNGGWVSWLLKLVFARSTEVGSRSPDYGAKRGEGNVWTMFG